ncbi:MAG: nucleotide sugar dehydrogenase [Pseudonocardia sp.]
MPGFAWPLGHLRGPRPHHRRGTPEGAHVPGRTRHEHPASDGLDNDTLRFDTTAETAVASHVVFLCLPTPPDSDGAADLTAIEHTVTKVRNLLRPNTVLVTKSTVPVGTSNKISAWLGREDVAVVSNPEFLREGHAVYDFLHPARILIGAHDPAAAKRIAGLYDNVRAEVILTDLATAELAKYAANCFLATKLSYINTVAELCEVLGADVTDLTYVLGADPRIGADFLRPGPGWGGPCLPKDTRALLSSLSTPGSTFLYWRRRSLATPTTTTG